MTYMHGKIVLCIFSPFLMLQNHIVSSPEPHNSGTVTDISYFSTVLKTRDYRLSEKKAYINDISALKNFYEQLKDVM